MERQDALADSYGHGWQRGSPLRSRQMSNINSKEFEHDRYVTNLISESPLEDLLQKHVAWSAEIKNLDSDMQMLVYENYSKFISATDTIKRMKENIGAMESSMEKLLESVTAVQSKSAAINNSLGEKREKIEALNGTRSLLRKVEFIFDLPKRLDKFVEQSDYASAVRAYVGALPILEEYGDSSFQRCEEECGVIIRGITRQLQGRVMSNDATPEERSEASVLLQELNEPVGNLMDEFLANHWDRLMQAVKGESPSFIEDFERTAVTFREVFPMGEERFTEATKDIFNEYFGSVQRVFSWEEGGTRPQAPHLISVLKRLSRDVVSMDALVPNAQLPHRAAQAVETAVSEYVVTAFSHLGTQVTSALHPLARLPPSHPRSQSRSGLASSLGPKPLQAVLEAAHRSLVQGSHTLMSDLALLLDDSVALLRDWRAEFVDLVHSEFHSLFTSLNLHFRALCSLNREGAGPPPPPPMHVGGASSSSSSGGAHPSLVLLLSRLSQAMEQAAVPRVTEVLTRTFSGGTMRGVEGPAFDPHKICGLFSTTAEVLLQQYVDTQSRTLSLIIRKSTATPNWVKHKEPRDVRMVADLILQEVNDMEEEVEQLLPPGADRSLAYFYLTHSKDASSSSGSGAMSRAISFRDTGRGGTDAKISNRGRNLLLERDVAKLFTQRVELFSKLEFTQTWVVSTVIKMSLKTFQECVRLQTFGRSGYQQMQLDTLFLKDALRTFVDEETIVELLLDEVCVAAVERCWDPMPMEPAVMERIIQTKLSKST